MPTRVSKVQNQSQRERRIRIRGQIIFASHCVLRELPDRTFVHSLQNSAFRRAGGDNARQTFTGNIFAIHSRAC